jgi:uncharacterized RDD family membrane protein YckC
MHLVCPRCQSVLEFAEKRPAFCAYCGQPVTDTPLPDTDLYSGSATLPPAGPAAGVADAWPSAVGGFRLLRPLGTGGMGTVFEAEEEATGRRVAVKLIAPEFTSPDSLSRFRREGLLASRIVHPRCVFVLKAEEEAGRPYIVMELMPGRTLEDHVRERGPLPPAEAVAKILDVVEGLQEVHRHHVIHRDIKPSNCFLDADGRVKIGDFGLSRSLADEGRLTRLGTFMGSPLFASPEQVRGDELDQGTDVYSAAATLYHLLTGRAPHQAGDLAATMARIVADDAPSLRSLRPDIPPALDQAVRRGLERDRQRRWRDLEEFRQALLPFLPGQLSIGGMGIRLGAFLVDYVLLATFSFILWLAATWLTGHGGAMLVDSNFAFEHPLYLLISPLLWILYFTALEGRWGGSAGKWLLRLRVCTAAGYEVPGLGRALVRTLVFYTASNLGFWVPVILVYGRFVEVPKPEDYAEGSSGWLWVILSMYPLWALGVALLLCTMRARTGYRGLHEYASGTRVVRLPWARRRQAAAVPAPAAALGKTDELPARVGAFAVRGAYHRTAGEQILAGEDESLGRSVLLWLRPAADPPLPAARKELSRDTRLRWLGGGKDGDVQWEAFLAPAGCPLAAQVSRGGRLCWPDARPLLEQLGGELAAAHAEGSLPGILTTDQVWVQADGRALLLDTPLTGTVPEGEAPLAEDDPQEQALALLAETAILALEGDRRSAGDAHPPVRAPVPEHASRLLDRLLGGKEPYGRLEELQNDLVATRELPGEVTRGRRLGQLALLTASLSVGLFCCVVPSGFTLGLMNWMPAFSNSQGGERVLRELETGLAAELLAASLHPDPPGRLFLTCRYADGVSLRDRLQHHLRQAQIEKQALRQSLGPVTKAYTDLVEEQVERSTRPKIEASRAGGRPFPGSAGDYRLAAQSALKTPARPAFDVMAVVIVGFQLLTWPLLWVVWSFVTRGGVSLRLMGLSLVRSDGRRASRLRCAWRTLLVWLPVTALLGLSLILEIRYWSAWSAADPSAGRGLFWASTAVWYAGLALLVAYGALALWSPARSLHDRLAGTYLVPK